MMLNPVFLAVSEASMRESNQNVQKNDVQRLDAIRIALSAGYNRLVVRTRRIKLNWWSGNVTAEETITTVEPTDARH
jgi:hypothetical protein